MVVVADAAKTYFLKHSWETEANQNEELFSSVSASACVGISGIARAAAEEE